MRQQQTVEVVRPRPFIPQAACIENWQTVRQIYAKSRFYFQKAVPSGQYLSYSGQTSTMLSSYGSSRDLHSSFRSKSPIFLPRPRHLTHRVTLRNPLNTATWWHIVEDNSKTIDRGQTKFTTHNLQWCVNRKQSRLGGHAPSFHKQPVLNIDKPCGNKQNHGSISKMQCQAGSIYPIQVKPRPCCRVMVLLEMRFRL